MPLFSACAFYKKLTFTLSVRKYQDIPDRTGLCSQNYLISLSNVSTHFEKTEDSLIKFLSRFILHVSSFVINVKVEF